MPEKAEFPRTPLVLITIDQEWTARSLESILSPAGYAVVKARKGEQALELLKRITPDLLVIDHELPDMAGTALAQKIRRRSVGMKNTPLVILTMDSLSREQRIAALKAGAWEIVRAPFDQEELTQKLNAFVGAKLRADEAREESLVDARSGFYNIQGLLKRVSELSADASRHRRPLACVVVAPDLATQDAVEQRAEPEEVGNDLASALAQSTRISDTVGRLGETEFVVIAPGATTETAAVFAERLVERIASLDQTRQHLENGSLRAGYYAVDEGSAESVVPVDILTRATLALRRAQADQDGFRVQPYQN